MSDFDSQYGTSQRGGGSQSQPFPVTVNPAAGYGYGGEIPSPVLMSLVSPTSDGTEKPILLLDLDGTLVMTTNSRELVNSLRTPDFTFWLIDELTFGYRRPNVEEFLVWCNKHFRVYLWTAAHGTYAQLVMEALAQLVQDYEATISATSSFDVWSSPPTAEDGQFVPPKLDHLIERESSQRSSTGSRIGSRLPSTDTETSRKVSVVLEREESLHIESYSDGNLTKTEEEGENFTYYEEVASRESSRAPSREPSQTGLSSGGIVILSRRESQSLESFGEEFETPTTHSFLDEPEHTRPPIPVLQIFDKNECLIEWKGAGAWVTKDLHTLRQKYFSGVSEHNFVVIDNDPYTYNRNKRQAIPINTYWGSTHDDELVEIMTFLKETYLPCPERDLLDLQAWNSKGSSNSGELL